MGQTLKSGRAIGRSALLSTTDFSRWGCQVRKVPANRRHHRGNEAYRKWCYRQRRLL